MCIKELTSNPPTIGVTFVDTATAHFHISSFVDDTSRTFLETLLVQIVPTELVLEKGSMSKETMKVVKKCLEGVQVNYLDPIKEFWGMERTLDELMRGEYFEKVDGQTVYPESIQAKKDDECAMSSLGGLLNYLRTVCAFLRI